MAKKRTRSTTRRHGRSTRSARHASKLSTVSTADLQAEIQRRERELMNRRDQLASELEQIESEMAELAGLRFTGHINGAPSRSAHQVAPARTANRARTAPEATTTARGRKRRPRNQMNLVDALHDLLKGETMSVTDMAAAVQEAGYRTRSPNFRTIVNQALINHPDRFHRVSRGKYTSR